MARYQPALLGGLFIGVLSALPVLNLANCCCLWVILGGMLATYLQQQNTPAPIETSTAALSGLMAGAIGGFISGVAGMLMLSMVGGADSQQAIEQALSNIPNLPPETAEWVRSLTQGRTMALVSMVVTVPIYAVFGMLGALLGLAFFRKKITPETPMGPPA
jgi:ABC-type arginine transport system permease subunit